MNVARRALPPDAPARIRVLDAFRGLAVSGVMCVHLLPGLFPYGAFGVHLFFMVSGFVILMTLERCQHLFEFWYRRFARLYPAYVTAMLLSFLVAALLGPPDLRNSGRDLLAGVVMLAKILPGTKYIDGVYWTLTVELQFYLLVGVLWLAARNRFVAVWSAFVLVVLVMWQSDGVADPVLHVIARRLFIARHLAHFSLGMACYCLQRRRYRPVAVLAALSVLAYAVTWHDAPASNHAAHAVLLLAPAMFAAGWLQWLVWSPLLFVGDISYPLYLLHNRIGVTLIARLSAALHWPHALLVSTAIATIVVAAWLLRRYVELPAQRWLLAALRPRLPMLRQLLPDFGFRALAGQGPL